MSCGIGRRRSSDPTLWWLWRGPEATAPIRPLAWEPPYAAGAAQEMAKKRQPKKKNYFKEMAQATIKKNYVYKIYIYIWPRPDHVKILRPEIKPVPQQQPETQQ